MDLKTFVSESLSEVIQGIEEAQTATTNSQINSSDVAGYQQKVVTISFDIAVTVEQGMGTKGGIKVLSGMLNLGSSGESKKSDSTTHRIQFSVPVRLPFQSGDPILLPERKGK